MSVSESVQMYLLTIYRLTQEGEVAPTNARLAERLGVSAVSVTEMVRKLHEKGLILKKRRAIALSREGERIALNVIRKHRLAERLLVDRLGIPWAHAYDQACKLETFQTRWPTLWKSSWGTPPPVLTACRFPTGKVASLLNRRPGPWQRCRPVSGLSSSRSRRGL